MKSKNEKKGFALLLEWAGNNKFLIYLSVLFALFASVCNIAPYYIFYRIIDSAVDGSLTIRYGADLAWLLIVFTAIRVICNAFATLSSHKGAYNTLFKGPDYIWSGNGWTSCKCWSRTFSSL
jgi:ATP-binding cassette subfamily B protein